MKKIKFKTVFILILFIILQSTSCKKEELTGDFEILVGKWECIGKSEGSSITSAETGEFEHTLEFMESGKYKITKDNNNKERGRVISLEESTTVQVIASFYIELKNNFRLNTPYFSGEYDVWIQEDNSIEILAMKGSFIKGNSISCVVRYKRIY